VKLKADRRLANGRNRIQQAPAFQSFKEHIFWGDIATLFLWQSWCSVFICSTHIDIIHDNFVRQHTIDELLTMVNNNNQEKRRLSAELLRMQQQLRSVTASLEKCKAENEQLQHLVGDLQFHKAVAETSLASNQKQTLELIESLARLALLEKNLARDIINLRLCSGTVTYTHTYAHI
jgi:DNA repair exonuclease SbcCD ATPase subunit